MLSLSTYQRVVMFLCSGITQRKFHITNPPGDGGESNGAVFASQA
jgi:hypothetical protein